MIEKQGNVLVGTTGKQMRLKAKTPKHRRSPRHNGMSATFGIYSIVLAAKSRTNPFDPGKEKSYSEFRRAPCRYWQ